MTAPEPIRARYRIVAKDEAAARKVGEEIAAGQTVAARPEHQGRLLELSSTEVVAENVPRGTLSDPARGAFLATVAFPRANVEDDLATILVMIYGKVSLAPGIRVVGLELPREVLDRLPGPKLGIDGIRARTGVRGRPLTMAIFKPAVGATPAELAALMSELALGGADIVKDDEILPDLPGCRTVDRLEACRAALERARRAGAAGDPAASEPLYAVTLTGRAPELVDRAAELVRRGATALLFSPLAYGISLLEALARDPRVTVPIVAHPALAGGFCGAPDVGFAYPVLLGTIFRAAGADIVLYPSSYGKPALPEADAFALRDALREPLGDLRPVLPGPSAGVHPGMVPRILGDHGTDVLVNAGSGVHGHPDGPRAGARAFRQAIDLTLAGRDLGAPGAPPELARAIAKWGTA